MKSLYQVSIFNYTVLNQMPRNRCMADGGNYLCHKGTGFKMKFRQVVHSTNSYSSTTEFKFPYSILLIPCWFLDICEVCYQYCLLIKTINLILHSGEHRSTQEIVWDGIGLYNET